MSLRDRFYGLGRNPRDSSHRRHAHRLRTFFRGYLRSRWNFFRTFVRNFSRLRNFFRFGTLHRLAPIVVFDYAMSSRSFANLSLQCSDKCTHFRYLERDLHRASRFLYHIHGIHAYVTQLEKVFDEVLDFRTYKFAV